MIKNTVSGPETKIELLKALRQPISKAHILALSSIVLAKTELINDLFQIIETQSLHDAMLASWLLCHLHEADDKLLETRTEKIIALLFSTGSDSVRRNLLKIAADFPVPEAAAAQLFDQCLQWMLDENRAIAVRCNAMQLLFCICQSEPELASEVKTAILLVNNYGSAGFRSRAKKILKKLKVLQAHNY